jgi:uncharacterized protein YegL
MRGGNYQKEKALLKAIGREFDVSMYGSHVSIVLYNNDAEVIVGLNNKTTLKSFENTVDNLPLKGGKIRLDKAVRLAASDVFTKEKGMRDEDVPKIMFILTDGTQNRKCDEEALELAIAPLRNNGVRVVAIGVGEADENELRPLVKSQRDLFIGADFDEVTQPIMDLIKGSCREYGTNNIVYFCVRDIIHSNSSTQLIIFLLSDIALLPHKLTKAKLKGFNLFKKSQER